MKLIGFNKVILVTWLQFLWQPVPVTPMTFVKFHVKFANPSESYEIDKTRIRRFAYDAMAKHVVIQDRQGDHTASVVI
jgi:hypothetical protein